MDLTAIANGYFCGAKVIKKRIYTKNRDKKVKKSSFLRVSPSSQPREKMGYMESHRGLWAACSTLQLHGNTHTQTQDYPTRYITQMKSCENQKQLLHL